MAANQVSPKSKFNASWVNGATDQTIKNSLATPAGKGYVLAHVSDGRWKHDEQYICPPRNVYCMGWGYKVPSPVV